MRATDLLIKAIEIIKQNSFYITVNCQFVIVKEGLFPSSNKKK